jgi:hypothetical protein
MNEDQKVNTTKAKLPIKTKFAMWWLILFGIALTAFYFLFWGYITLLDSADGNTGNNPDKGPLFILFLGSIFYFLSGIFVSRKTKLSWIVGVTFLCIVAICSLGSYIYLVVYRGYDHDAISQFILCLLPLFLLLPIILIILDRKNYFEMVRQRKLDKNITD